MQPSKDTLAIHIKNPLNGPRPRNIEDERHKNTPLPIVAAETPKTYKEANLRAMLLSGTLKTFNIGQHYQKVSEIEARNIERIISNTKEKRKAARKLAQKLRREYNKKKKDFKETLPIKSNTN